jgi:cytidylate kinase
MIITLDGPVASGKTTIGFLLANKLYEIYNKNFYFLDTGLIYRKYTYLFLYQKVTFNTKEPTKDLDYFRNLLVTNITLQEFEEKTKYLFTEEIAINTSKLATKKKIRNYLNKIQIELVDSKNVVVVGRDSGTVVFKNADFKFFLYASNYIRAIRRYNQYKQNNPDILKNLSFHEILMGIIKRDEQDKNRKYSPLPDVNNLPKDFILINTDNLTIEETLNKIISYITIKNNL